MRFLSVSTALLTIMAASPALAQETAAGGQPLSGQDATTQQAPNGAEVAPADIVVTAQRRSESIQRVPVSLTAVTADTLKSQQINDLTQVTRLAPSLQLGQDSTFSVRGVGTLAFSGTIDSSVAVAIDDVNLGRPLLNAPKFMDLERVEVLNGPQGLLFGKNASSGLLNVVTARPRLNEYSGITDVEFSSRDTPGADRTAPGIIVQQTLNVPIGDKAALRVNGLYAYEEPPQTYVGTAAAGVRNDFNRGTRQIKAKLLVEPSDALTIYAIGDYNRLSGSGGINTSTYRSTAPNSINAPGLAFDGITPSTDNFLFGGDGGYYRDVETGGAQVSIGYRFDSGFEISNLAAWRFYNQNAQLDVDATSLDGANINHTVSGYDQYSDELRLALPTGNRLTGQVGLYAFKSTLRTDSLIAGGNYVPSFVQRGFPFCVGANAVPGAFPPTCSVSNAYFLGSDRNYKLDTTSLAAFGQLTFAVTDKFNLIAGGRVTNDKIDIDLVQGRNRYFVALGGPSVTTSQDYKNTNFSWKLGAQYQLTPVIMAYGFYGRGYKGPGFNDQAVNATTSLVVRPETSNAAEVGIKSSFLDRRVTLNVSAFTTKFNDFQVQSFDTNVRAFVVQNAASVRTKGADVTLALVPFKGLTLSEGASILSSKFIDFPGAQCYATQTSQGCSATVGVFNAGGFTLPGAPKFTSTLVANYDFPAAGNVVPFVQGNWYHRSSIWYSTNHAPGTLLGKIDTFNFSLGAKVGDALRVSFFCKNCTNVHQPTSITVEPGDASASPPRLTYTQAFNLDSVRSIGLTLNSRF